MNDFIDFNDADEQFDMSALIPHGTFCRVRVDIRSSDESGLTDAKNSDSKMLDCEFTVTAGKYANKKFWTNLVVLGTSGKKDSSGRITAHNISKATLRAILESTRGVMPDDTSAEAVNNRKLSGYGDFNGMEFATKINIQKAKPGTQFDDQNTLGAVITPDKENYAEIMGGGDGLMGEVAQVVQKPAAANTQQWGTQKPAAAKEEAQASASPVDEIPEWAK